MAVLIGNCPKNQSKKTTISGPENYVNLVYPQLYTDNSSDFLFTTAFLAFGMVNLNPDTQIIGAWGSGYHYETATIKGFSNIYGWQITGLSVMPVSAL